MRTFHYSTSVKSVNELNVDDTIVVSNSTLGMDYHKWVRRLTKYGRNFIYDCSPIPIYGFRVKELKPKPNQIII